MHTFGKKEGRVEQGRAVYLPMKRVADKRRDDILRTLLPGREGRPRDASYNIEGQESGSKVTL